MSESDAASVLTSGLQRAAALLNCFDLAHPQMSLSLLTRRSGLPKTTVHRMARQLVELGWLTRQGDAYFVGNGLFEVASLAPLRSMLREVALPYLQDLYEQSHGSVHLAVREGGHVLYVEKLRGHDDSVLSSRVGGRMPLHCTGLGKVLLAAASRDVQEQVLSGRLVARTSATITSPDRLREELSRVTALGLGYDRQESAVGTRCVAAPIMLHDHRVVAAVSVSTGSSIGRLEDIGASLRANAAAIGQRLSSRAAALL
jgi:DNA-binding IclR family transcriptional regulator